MMNSSDALTVIRRPAGLKRGVAAIVAVLTCPCHLPIVLPILLSLTAGTALGAWLLANAWSVWALSGVLFVVSLTITLRGLAGRTTDGGEAR